MNTPENDLILCTRCGKKKDISAFYRSKTLKKGYKTPCKECKREYNREYFKDTFQKGDRRRPELPKVGISKTCSKCHKKKDLSEFHVDNKRVSGYKTDCKECFNAYERRRVERMASDGE